MSAQGNLNPDQFSKGDRVEHKKNHKVGELTRDPHATMTGHAAYVYWDGGKTNFASPVDLKNLRKIQS